MKTGLFFLPGFLVRLATRITTAGYRGRGEGSFVDSIAGERRMCAGQKKNQTLSDFPFQQLIFVSIVLASSTFPG